MKITQQTSKSLKTLLALLAATVTTQAQTVTNTFTNPNLDLVNTGVIGSGFTGVDLNSGDIPGGSGTGNTAVANSGAFVGQPGNGFLFLENVVGGFSGTEDDGFFSFNVVWGDFDAYVDVTAPYPAVPYTFTGLLARAISDGTGQPYNPTGTNASENWLNITRFEEFSIPTQVRYASNAADNQITVTNLFGKTDTTNADVFLRLNRTGDVFNFYDSATYGGPWTLERTITRTDLHGAAMQVGIEEGSFAGSGAGASIVPTVSDFGIQGTNTYTPPAGDPSNVLVSNPNTNGTVELSWVPGAGTDGSIVVVSENIPQTQSPYYGFNYVANTNFGSVVNMGGHQQVMYVGSATNITVGGFQTSSDNYNVAVYSYTSNGGTTPITYDANPATTSFVGPGVVVSISATLSLTSIPVNGVATLNVVANFSSGGTLNVSGQSSATSSDPAINASVQNGIIVLSASAVTAGNTNGNVNITYSTFSYNLDVTSHTPVFTDNFGTQHSYLTNGVGGTGWDGVYEKNTDILGVTLGDGAQLSMSLFDSDITSNNTLTISSANGFWKGNDDNGAFLYKVVPGDFEASVHITGYGTNAGGGGTNAIVASNQVAYLFGGLMARGISTANNASPFGPGGVDGTEDNVNWQRFDQFGDTTVLFNTRNGNITETDDKDGDSTDFWLLMTRVNGTNFNLFKSATFGGPWTLVHSVVQPALTSGTFVQIGLEMGTYTANTGIMQFDTFMLDGDNIVGSLLTPAAVPNPATGVSVALTAGDSQALISWTQPSGGATAFVVMRSGSPVSSQPYFGDLTTAAAAFGTGTDLGGGNFVVYRGTGNNVTVTGLVPGTQYYVIVYEYLGSSSTKAFEYNNTESATPPIVFTGITANVSSAAVPINGIGGAYHVLASIQGTTNLLDVSASSTLIATNGIVTGTNGLFTGISLGTDTNVTFAFSAGGSNFTTSAVSVSTRASTYSDNFSKPINYLTLAQNAAGNASAATAGTIWDGIFLGDSTLAPAGYSIPNGVGGSPGGVVLGLDASITETNALTLVHNSDQWGGGGPGGENDGFLLYKNVVGDFQASIFVTNMVLNTATDDNMSGIMARLATSTGAAPAGPGNETFASMNEFEQFALVDVIRFETSGNDNNFGDGPQPTPVVGAKTGFLIMRTHGTNFTFYRRNGSTNAFFIIPGYGASLPLFAENTTNVVEVGPDASTYGTDPSGNTTAFQEFMLDLTTGPVLSFAASAGNLTISWDASDSFQHIYTTTSLSSPFVLSAATVTTVNGVSSVTVPIGAGNSYYVAGP